MITKKSGRGARHAAAAAMLFALFACAILEAQRRIER
jgi:hypothetical protein